MSGIDEKSLHKLQKSDAILDEEYVGKEVVVIAFDKEKTAVRLEDNFILLQAIEKRERRTKVVAAVLAIVGLVGIVFAGIQMMQAGDARSSVPVEPVVTAYVVTMEPSQEPTVTPEVTSKPTSKPTKAPKKTPKPTKKPKKTKAPVTKAPVKEAPITKAPVATKAPKPKPKPKNDDASYIGSDDDGGDEEVTYIE